MDERGKVIVTNFDMSFWRKVRLTIRREVAAIPAAFILIISWFLLMGILERMILDR